MKDTEMGHIEQNEPFVDVEKYLSGKVLVDMKYFSAGRSGAVNRAYLRRQVADRLGIAASYLPFGYRFLIYDAWRPYGVQLSLYDEYYNSLLMKEENLGKSEEELHKATRIFVSYPDRELDIGYVHSSGGAVDLTLVDAYGREVDMGCGFDDFTDIAFTDALDGREEMAEARSNRQILLYAMEKAGFTNYPYEWWHYDYGDVFWQRATGEQVKFASVYSVSDMILFEKEGLLSDREPITL